MKEEWRKSRCFTNNHPSFNENSPVFRYADGAFIAIEERGSFTVYVGPDEYTYDRLSEAENSLWNLHSKYSY